MNKSKRDLRIEYIIGVGSVGEKVVRRLKDVSIIVFIRSKRWTNGTVTTRGSDLTFERVPS